MRDDQVGVSATPPRRLNVTVIADSVSRYGDRITTLELTFPRFILAELNTHRAFSRNSASSRARSVKKTIAEVRADPFVPWHWPAERLGMAGGESIGEDAIHNARAEWRGASLTAIQYAEALVWNGVHKSIVNRLLEPFMWHTVVVTATDWDGFLDQRLALLEDGRPAAEPHFYDLARAMKIALDTSIPVERGRDDDDASAWHLPYVTEAERRNLFRTDVIKMSVARCAGVSYLNQNAERPLERDLALYDRLRAANPPHWSPFEHVARPATTWSMFGGETHASPHRYNLVGWESLRWLLEAGLARLDTLGGVTW